MNTKNIVYQEYHTEVNQETGEITNKQNRKILKVQRTPDFIMLFTEHVAFLEKLAKNEKAVLSQILQHYVGIKNVVFLSANTKKDMADELHVGISYIHKAIKQLIERQILVKGIIKTNQLYLNPYLFGKGNWENIYQMRQEISYDFDFAKLEMKETRKISALYDNDFDINKHDIVDKEEYQDIDGANHQEITITEKNDELSILKIQKEIKELSIKEMELKLQMKKQGLI